MITTKAAETTDVRTRPAECAGLAPAAPVTAPVVVDPAEAAPVTNGLDSLLAALTAILLLAVIGAAVAGFVHDYGVIGAACFVAGLAMLPSVGLRALMRRPFVARLVVALAAIVAAGLL